MYMKMRFMTGLVVMVILLGLCACSRRASSELVNEMHFSLSGISEVVISYDEEEIIFYESEGDELTVKEYMTENKSSYYAKVSQSGNSIKISEGGKPFFKDNFTRYVEVYWPASYYDNLTVTTTNGGIDLSEIDLELNKLRIDSTSGMVRLKDVRAADIHLSSASGVLELGRLHGEAVKIETTSADVTCEELDGRVVYTTTSGNACIGSASGSGSYKANNSGNLEVTYTEVSGDLEFFNKNDNVSVTLPSDLSFEFAAATKNGSVTTSFSECVSMDGQTVRGIVGDHPVVTVEVETKNGNIEVKQ